MPIVCSVELLQKASLYPKQDFNCPDHSQKHATLEPPLFKAGTIQHKHTGCSYHHLSEEVMGAGSNVSPHFLKKQHLAAKLPSRLATTLCMGCFIMSSHITVLENTQINPSPGSRKQPDSLGLMAAAESRGDGRHRSNSSVSIF